MIFKLYPISFSIATVLAIISFNNSHALADSTSIPENEPDELLSARSSDTPLKTKAAEFQHMLQSLETREEGSSPSSLAQDHESIPSENIPIHVIEEASPQEDEALEEGTSLVLEDEENPPKEPPLPFIAGEKPLQTNPSPPQNLLPENPTSFVLEKDNAPPTAEQPVPQSEALPSQENPPLSLNPQNLPKVDVSPHPPIQPLAEESTPLAQAETPTTTVSFTEAAKGRTPLGLLDLNEAPSAKKWYLYASAKRGMNSPSDTVDIISVAGEKGISSSSAEEIKSLLLEMGLNTQIRVIHATGDEGQAGKVYLFGEK